MWRKAGDGRSGPMGGWKGAGLLAGALLWAGVGPAPAAQAPLESWGAALPEPVLAEQRGGFINAEGLKIAVGLESLVRINGELRSAMQVQLPDLRQLARGGHTLGSQLEVIQNGPGNALPGDFADQVSGLGTVIQNSLNDQVIQNLKSLNIEISGYRGLRNSQLKSRINSQIVESLR